MLYLFDEMVCIHTPDFSFNWFVKSCEGKFHMMKYIHTFTDLIHLLS